MYLLLQKISIRRDRGRNAPCAVSGQPTYLQGTGKYSDTQEGAVHPHSPPFSWVFTGSLLQLEWGNSSIFTHFLLKLVFFFKKAALPKPVLYLLSCSTEEGQGNADPELPGTHRTCLPGLHPNFAFPDALKRNFSSAARRNSISTIQEVITVLTVIH